MFDQIITYAKEVTKTAGGGVVVGCTTHAVFDIVSMTQYASFFAAMATGIYFLVVTWLAIRNRDRK